MCVCAEGFAGLGQGGDWRKLSLMEDVAIFLFSVLMLLSNYSFFFRCRVTGRGESGGAGGRSAEEEPCRTRRQPDQHERDEQVLSPAAVDQHGRHLP